MKLRLNRLLAFAVVSVIACLLVVWGVWRNASLRSSAILHQANDSLKRDIDQELPRGSDKSRVVEFLSAHDMYTDGYRTLGGSYKPVYDEASAIIDANKKIETSALVCEIHVTFKFDNNEKLQGYRDNVVCKGPF